MAEQKSHPSDPEPQNARAVDEPLTEEMAIKYTRQALEDKGYDVSRLVPREYWPEYPEGHTERIFARNRLKGKENDGYVLWGPVDEPWTYLVGITKNGSEVKCKIYRSK